MGLVLSTADVAGLERAANVVLGLAEETSFDSWRAGVAGALRAVVDGDCAVFLTQTADGKSGVGDNRPPEFAAACATLMATPLDTGRARLPKRGCTIYTQDRIVAGDWAQYRRDPAVNEFFWPNALRDVVAFNFEWHGADGAPRIAMVIVYNDRYGAAGFGDCGAGLFRLLKPAMQAAVVGRMHAAASSGDVVRLIDALDGAAMLADAGGGITYRSPALEALIATDPERETVRRAMSSAAVALAQRLRTPAKAEDRADALRAAGAAALRQVRTRMAHYEIRAVHVRDDRGEPMILVTAEVMAQAALVGLTRREREVAVLLAAGRSNAAIAEHLGISLATARHHTEAILRKFGVSTRAAIGARLSAPARPSVK